MVVLMILILPVAVMLGGAILDAGIAFTGHTSRHCSHSMHTSVSHTGISCARLRFSMAASRASSTCGSAGISSPRPSPRG